MEKIWLDCEQNPRGKSAYEICQLIDEAHRECGAFPHGIYTRGSWWRPYTADSDRWSELPLWDAYYDDKYSLDVWGGPYGGWQKPWMKQYAENVSLGGKTVDLNIYLMES